MMKTKFIPLAFIIVIVGVVNFVTMPRYYYPGDARAIKLAAINLLKNNDFGIDYRDRGSIDEFLSVSGNAYHDNTKKEKFFSRWGAINTILFAIPELMRRHDALAIDAKTIFNHNCLNIIISILIAAYLFNIGALYSRSTFSRVFYTVTVLYTTFYWNYLRAQSYDILQIMFFLAFYYHFVSYRRKPYPGAGDSTIHLVASLVALIFLVLSKPFYVFIYAAWMLCRLFDGNMNTDRRIRREFYFNIVSIAFLMVVITLSNKYFYGTYIFTGNASHDPYNPVIIPFSAAYYPLNAQRYLLGVQSNVFLHFPPLLFSILGLRRFFAEYKQDAFFIGATFLIFVLIIGAFYSTGEWCYGPRFFLFILPLLSLPVLSFVDDWVSNIRDFRHGIVMAVMGLALVSATLLQTSVNSRHFFIRYYLQDAFSYYKDAHIDAYFETSMFGTIAADFNRFMKTGSGFFPVIRLSRKLSADSRDPFTSRVQQHFKQQEKLHPNFYFHRPDGR